MTNKRKGSISTPIPTHEWTVDIELVALAYDSVLIITSGLS
jgi:hypothetical protein